VVERTVQRANAGNCLKISGGCRLQHIELNQPNHTFLSDSSRARLLVEKSRRGGEVNDPLKAKQRVTLNRLKQKIEPLKRVCCSSEEPNNSSVALRNRRSFLLPREQQAAWRSLQVAMNDTVQATMIVPSFHCLPSINQLFCFHPPG